MILAQIFLLSGVSSDGTCIEIDERNKGTMHKRCGFPLRISVVNVIKSAGNSGFDHIY